MKLVKDVYISHKQSGGANDTKDFVFVFYLTKWAQVAIGKNSEVTIFRQ
jgi:hypothetical protein